MVRANLAGAVMVANIVKIRLGERHAEETQGHEDDPESSQASMFRMPPQGHVQAPLEKKTDQHPLNDLL